jgi:hypothetical protein
MDHVYLTYNYFKNIIIKYLSKEPPNIKLNQNCKFTILLMTVQFEMIKNNEEMETCGICLENLKNRNVSVMTCDHYFHSNCLLKWKKINSICPICKRNII